jgi:signal transduction histidine kinase
LPRDRRDAVLAAVAHAGELLLGRDPWPQRLDAVLASLGEAAGVDRAYVFSVRPEDGVVLVNQTNEWVRPGVEPQIDNPDLQDLPLAESGMERWQEVLSAGGTIDGPVTSFPESEQPILLEQDIAALAVVPIHVDGEWWGFLGFDLVSDLRPFDAGEIATLRTAARMLGAAIARRRTLTSLEEQREQLAAAVRREQEVVTRLRELDRMKSSFLDAVSHELRTPLTVVLGMATVLRDRDGSLDEAQRDRVLEALHDGATRLERVLGHLLDLERLRREVGEPHTAPVDVDGVVRACLAETPGLASRAVHVDGHGAVLVDAEVLRQALTHLLHNAVVHTADDRQVWVAARSVEHGLRLTVADDGDGVPADIRDRVFEPFQHGQLRNPHQPGLGVGLSLLARLAHLHDGAAWCEERPGGGVAFHVELATRA